jgi:Cu-Zn family superoxide dismutase
MNSPPKVSVPPSPWSSLCGLLLLVVVPAAGQHPQEQGVPPVRASFAIIDSVGRRIGTLSATDAADGVTFQLEVSRLTAGLHGMHLHAKPACGRPDFASAGGHLNPGGKAHGRLNPEGAHLGDLPNLQVDRGGEARLSFVIPGVTLRAGPASIGVPGSAFILHAGQDDERTDPAGNSGPRVGCAVITVASH